MFWKSSKTLENYKAQLQELKNAALLNNLSEHEIEEVFQESLKMLTKEYRAAHEKEKQNAQRKKTFSIASLLIISCLFAYYYKPMHNFVERNIQDAIYPFMTLYRRATLPLVKVFPFLTDLYDESCLLENPYFQVTDMECWPCESARGILNLTNSISKAVIAVPFVSKVAQPLVSLDDFRDVYLTHKDLINSNAGRIESNTGWWSIEHLLGNDIDLVTDYPNAHVSWRINRMETGRAFRTLLKPPQDADLPSFASTLGIERFLLIDGPSASQYTLPSTENANVFVKQLTGERIIVLEPSPECRGTCRRLSILLEQQHILWYNWWYWRPRSLPVLNSSSISIAFIGSSV